MERLVKLVATFFYIGEIPFIPGTLASFAGLLLYLGAFDKPVVCAGLFLLILVLGFLCAGAAEKIFGKKDPREVVIDEVVGIFIVFFQIPLHVMSLSVGFIVYRLLDIVKPYPAGRIQAWRGSSGIMFDDIVVAVYTNILLRLLLAWLPRLGLTPVSFSLQ